MDGLVLDFFVPKLETNSSSSSGGLLFQGV
jgi:hypothetical protein